MLQQLKTLMLPLAMLAGFLFSGFFAMLEPATPYLIFTMLFVTFCRVSPSEIKFTPMLLILLAVQILGGMAIYFVARLYDETFAQGAAICMFAPVATSSSVVAGMLGANITTMACFSLLSNMSVAVIAPIIFSFVGIHADIPFWQSFGIIFSKVGPLIIIPFVAALLLGKVWPRAHEVVRNKQIISFFLWALALMIVIGRTVAFVKAQDSGNYRAEIYIAIAAFVVCVAQFAIGRMIGKKHGDTIAGGQSLGQKNTVLAIWMAQTYLNPISSIGPASYVLWQNIVNSWQIWQHNKKSS
jgi:BASS family bile acid:Na+ symporter